MASKNCRWVMVLGFAVGFLTGATASLIMSRRRSRGLHVPGRPVGAVVQDRGEGGTLYEPLTRTYVSVRDRRREFGNAPVSEEEVRSFLARRRELQAGPRTISVEWPPPGGLGAGVAFGNGLLHFADYTAVYFYLVAPPQIGPQSHADLLYMTSSNTAARGCEALLSFFDSDQYKCVFRVWDWAHPDVQQGGGKFVKGSFYNELSDYLIPYSFKLESGQDLNAVCLYVVNVTRRVKGDSFQNEVYLHNHMTGTRDLVWSYLFDWPDKNATQAFWWGPIFETFPNPGAQYSLTNPTGFDNTLIVQDGLEYQLTDQNSTMTSPSGNGLTQIYRSVGTNSGLVCR